MINMMLNSMKLSQEESLLATKLDYDSLNRNKQKSDVKVHDLEAQIETLNLRDSKNNRLLEQISESQL